MVLDIWFIRKNDSCFINSESGMEKFEKFLKVMAESKSTLKLWSWSYPPLGAIVYSSEGNGLSFNAKFAMIGESYNTVNFLTFYPLPPHFWSHLPFGG